MQQTPTEQQRQERDRAQQAAVNRLLGQMPRQVAHTMRDALVKAWEAGCEYGRRHPV